MRRSQRCSQRNLRASVVILRTAAAGASIGKMRTRSKCAEHCARSGTASTYQQFRLGIARPVPTRKILSRHVFANPAARGAIDEPHSGKENSRMKIHLPWIRVTAAASLWREWRATGRRAVRAVSADPAATGCSGRPLRRQQVCAAAGASQSTQSLPDAGSADATPTQRRDHADRCVRLADRRAVRAADRGLSRNIRRPTSSVPDDVRRLPVRRAAAADRNDAGPRST